MENPFDEAIFYIDTPTARYSTNDIKRGVASGAIAPETPIHTAADGQPFRADIVVAVNSTPMFPPVQSPQVTLKVNRLNQSST